MREILSAVGTMTLLICLFAAIAHSERLDPSWSSISISPHTLIIGHDQGGVTVHTNIPYGAVDLSQEITLGGVPAVYVKSDLRGNLVGKFSEAEIEAIVEPPEALLFLEGYLKDGEPFAGSDIVQVIYDPRRR